jgi:DNA-binding GntR family transcriptional regulator
MPPRTSRPPFGHDEILRMIEAHDPQGAADAMRAHLRALQAEFRPSSSRRRRRITKGR